MPSLLARLAPKSVRAKILLMFMAINLVATSAYTGYLYALKAGAITAEIDARLKSAAHAAPRMIGADYLERARGPQSVTEADYLPLVRMLYDYCQTIGLRYLYVFTEQKGRVIYVMDSASDQEIRAGNYGHYWGLYDDPTPYLWETFRSRRPHYAEYRDRYGHFRSIFLPLIRRDGSVLVIGADIDIQYVESELNSALRQSLAIGALIFLLGALLSLWLARLIARPLLVLTEAAHRIAQGDYATLIEPSHHDELGTLAQAFSRMSQAIASREKQIASLAFDDQLTGLPNRLRLNQSLSQEIGHAEPFAVVMIDIDRFKYINDYLGYGAGDSALKSIAARLREVLRPGDHLARLSGDEFVLVLRGVGPDTLERVVSRFHRVLENPLAIAGQTVDVAGSTGVALYPQHGNAANTLLHHAETAMYIAKRTHLPFVVYDPQQEENRKSVLSLLGELKTAVDHDQLAVFLQPKVSLRAGHVVGAEALVRWCHPERGWIPPGQFIPFAEQSGRIRGLTLWMLRRCLELHAQWLARGREIGIAVNVSINDLEDPQFVGQVESLLARHGQPHGMTLELTESGVMSAPSSVLPALERLRQLGFRLSIDDFGTGYSSLAYLSKLPVDELKIDRSFINELEQAHGEGIVGAVVELGHVLRLAVVAEGVETEAAWHYLRRLDCDLVQGFLVAKPMPIEEFETWLEQGWSIPVADSIDG
ncbi:putative bifunctional diguanylate cyclase/phosphodiesterase [Chitinimonas lacunae]|uniref:Bifunctional diguanylate cyclase/phosphodiesterase n=1 Tax=Chitinimonas lacunae TaxID=1963018 RepID=A0ABV8MW90_9NEIS